MKRFPSPYTKLEELNQVIVACRKCPRLVEWREHVAKTRRRAYQDQVYWGKPVTGFGDIGGKVLVVGLAPGAHGSNRTGRMFTGDKSGEFLYRALHECGYANQPDSSSLDDGLILSGIFISAVCRCAPPQNKPDAEEMQNCLPYLQAELSLMPQLSVIVALGKIGYDNSIKVLKSLSNGYTFEKFSHGSISSASGGLPVLIGSYHPSQQNTQTGRLTYPAFLSIWLKVRDIESRV